MDFVILLLLDLISVFKGELSLLYHLCVHSAYSWQAFIKSYFESIESEQSTKVKDAIVLGLAYGFSQVRIPAC